MLEGCRHRRFQVIFPIGRVEVVGNTGTSAEEFEGSADGNDHQRVGML